MTCLQYAKAKKRFTQCENNFMVNCSYRYGDVFELALKTEKKLSHKLMRSIHL